MGIRNLIESFLFVLVIILIGFVIHSCDSKKPTTEKPQAEVKPKKGIEFAWKNKDYDKQLIESIKKQRDPIRYVSVKHRLLDIKPTDWKNFTKEFPTTEEGKIEFWGKILVTMAWWESKWKTNTVYREEFGVNSRGLFQMSKASSNQYGCGWKTEEEINKNPLKAIDCAVAGLSYWLVRDGCLACKGKKDPNNEWDSGHRGGGRYWAVFRCVNKYTCDSLRALKKVNQ